MLEDDGDVTVAVPAATQRTGKPKGEGAKKVAKQPAICCPTLPRARNSKFCACHIRTWDSIVYQAEQDAEKRGDEEGRITVQELRNDDAKAAAAVLEQAKDNPPDRLYVRKKAIEWHELRKKHGIEVSKSDKRKEKPMTRQAFEQYCKTKLGISETETHEWCDGINADTH